MPTRKVVTNPNAARALYRVIFVCDGDCFCVAGGPHRMAREFIRLLCVDTPERGQKGWAESKAALRDLVEGKLVRLEPEHKWRYVRDRFGRCLAYVFIGDLLVNAELVRAGWSDYVTKFGRGRYAKTFDACKGDAELNRRGVWRMYDKGDSWSWGRGRKKPHFRSDSEYSDFKRRDERRKGEKNG